ncbi:MAG: hypothetical protein JOZ24_05380 [Candidatus Eremiobacteraeota bacterium]|nr:hypothetical protein [Candidatus Eremiobacteraeota bacterium]
MLRTLLMAACLAAIPAAGLAQPSPAPATTPVPLPQKPDFSALQFLVGTWNCSEQSSRRPAPITSTITWTMDPGGYWLIGRVSNPGVPWFPHASTGTNMITYDADAKRWVEVFSGSFGDYDVATSPGVSGGGITWHSIAFTPTANVASQSDIHLTFASPTSMRESYTFATPSGQNVTVNGTCTKT